MLYQIHNNTAVNYVRKEKVRMKIKPNVRMAQKIQQKDSLIMRH